MGLICICMIGLVYALKLKKGGRKRRATGWSLSSYRGCPGGPLGDVKLH